MNQSNDFPHDIDMEKELLSAMLIRNGEIVPAVSAIVKPDDFYRPEHKIIFQIILRLYEQGIPPNLLSIFEELRKSRDAGKVTFGYLQSVSLAVPTNAYAKAHAKIIKEKADFRQLIRVAEVLVHDAQQGVINPSDIIARAQQSFAEIVDPNVSPDKVLFADYFKERFTADIESLKSYADRKTGFDNIDAVQFFTPGLYVIGATPAAGKTTFCWQLLGQLAERGQKCAFCSYEMTTLELCSKAVACELFRRDKNTNLTAAQIRRGGHSKDLEKVVAEFAKSKRTLHVFELQDETIDDLLRLLKPLCSDKTQSPVVCLDYLQIMPTGRESTKLGIDETVRKLKKFQRDTNTTFVVISSFNRTNYAQSVSFESFKESGNIEYTADVVWALQLNVMNGFKGGEQLSEMRRKIEAAKKQQPRQIQLRCLKNRQGTNYDCLFLYHSAHDYFEPCASFEKIEIKPED